MKSIKRIIVESFERSDEILNDIAVRRKPGVANDHSLERNRTREIIDRLHPDVLKLKVDEIITLNGNAKTFRFVSETGYLPPFEAGQYINVFVEIDGVRTSRPYSLSSSPKQRAYFEITVARIATGFVSDYFLDKVAIGDRFEANGPAGVFHYNPVFHSKKSVFLAGGSGITPFLSMSREILETGLDREIHLIYGSRTQEAALYAEEFEAMAKQHKNFSYELVVSDPGENSCYNGRTGFINADCIKDVVGSVDDNTFYICGPQIMNDFCVEELKKLNVPSRMVRREMFGSRQDIENEPGWPSNLTGKEEFTVKIDGEKEIKARSGESLLNSLERAGIKMTVCCRSGECGLCRVKLVSGKVFAPRGVLLRHADEKYAYIHSCKAFPIEDLEIRIP